MQTYLSVGSTRSFALHEALLVYRHGHDSFGNGASAFVTKHAVKISSNGVPVLEAGTPITQPDILQMIGALRGSLPIEFLPENVLVRTPEELVWWTPAKVRTMFYAVEKGAELAALTGKRFPQPALIFRARSGNLEVRAIKSNSRPNPDTPLFLAPYWNVNELGGVCLGSTNVPREATVDSLLRWETAFFESEFTHANTSKRLTAHPGGFIGLWKSLIGKKRFPTHYLSDAKLTLGQFIKV